MKKRKPLLLAVLSLLLMASACSKKDKVNAPKETILYQSDFDKDDGQWSLGNFDQGNSAAIKDGYYQLVSGSIGQNYWIPSVFSTTTNATAIETSFKLTSNGTLTDGNGGLVWGYNEAQKKCFFFVLASSGQYAIYGYPDGTSKPVEIYQDWVLNSAIKKGQFNRIRIELKDQTLHFIINGSEVHKMTANNTGTLDQVGLTIYSSSAMQVDYYKAVQLP